MNKLAEAHGIEIAIFAKFSYNVDAFELCSFCSQYLRPQRDLPAEL
jgi:hypothetical protein